MTFLQPEQFAATPADLPGPIESTAHGSAGNELVVGKSVAFRQPDLVRALSPVITFAEGAGVRPADVAFAILSRWFASCYPALVCNVKTCARVRESKAVVDFCAALARLTLLEAGHWIGSAYAKLIDNSRRRALSMYFTPPFLAVCTLDELAAEGVDFRTRSFLDPACGGAAFLVPIALRMRDELRRSGKSALEIISHTETHLRGFDIDSTLCTLSRELLRAVLHEEIRASGREPRLAIIHGDALDHLASLQGSCDVVVCNPPYRKMGQSERARLPEEVAALLTHQPNLYAAFMALSVRALRDGGACALVTPTSFLSGRSFAAFRGWLGTIAQPLSLGIVDSRLGVFLDVQQEASVAIFRRGGRLHGAAALRIYGIGRNGRANPIGICRVGPGPLAWSVPRQASDARLVDAGARLPHRLADYGYQIRIGSFVWNRDLRKTYKSHATARRSKSAVVPLLWASDVKAGKRIAFDGRARPNGERRLVAVDDIQAPSIIRSACVLLQRVSSNDQPRRLIAGTVPAGFIRTYGGFLAENHTVALVPCVRSPQLSVSQMTELLGCDPIDRLFRCLSGSTNVSAFELAQLPLPCPKALSVMLAQGRSMEESVAALLASLAG